MVRGMTSIIYCHFNVNDLSIFNLVFCKEHVLNSLLGNFPDIVSVACLFSIY